MTQVDNLTEFSDQVASLIIADGSVATVRFKFDAATERWRIDVAHEEHIFNGVGLCCHPNILRQWRNVIPFGLSCITSDQTDPFTFSDLSTGRAKIYLLSEADVVAVEVDLMDAP